MFMLRENPRPEGKPRTPGTDTPHAQALFSRALLYNFFPDSARGSCSLGSPAVARFTIGRDKSCDIPLADDSVSRLHAEFWVEGSRLLIADRGSSNGTQLIRAGKPPVAIREAAVVFPSDQIQFGTAVLSVGEIVAAVRQRHPQAFPAPLPAQAQPQPAKAPAPADTPRLVRCLCGFIKPQNQICPECGQ